MASYDVFTPPHVALKLRSYLPSRVGTLLEPSVGTGQLISAFEGAYDTADVCELNPEYLAQVPQSPRITKYQCDFLTFEAPKLYDAIVLNPPYLRFQDMNDATRAVIKNLSPLTRDGNIDMYVAFLVKCISLLTNTGRMIAIVPSTWRYNKSCSAFRSYIYENKLIAAIHDYGSEKVFPGVNVYCCILVLTKTPNESYEDTGVIRQYTPHVNKPTQTLGDIADVQNGVATLCDEVFIHDEALYAEPCWKPILKVSKTRIRYIIYPYDSNGKIVPEEVFSATNPLTYAFLLTKKPQLGRRDKGKKTYEAWYAFGRKQGIHIPQTLNSVYVSTLSKPTIPTHTAPTMLFYSGLRVSSIMVHHDILSASIEKGASSVTHLCSKRGNGWINVTSTVLKQIPVQESE